MHKWFPKVVFLFKVFSVLGVLWFATRPFIQPNGLSFSKIDALQWDKLPWMAYVFLFGFACINLWLEVKKWKIGTENIQAISNTNAFKGVLCGITIGSVLPWRTGEFLGKAAFLKAENRVKGSFMAIYSSMTQLAATLFFGLCSLLMVLYYHNPFGELSFNTKGGFLLPLSLVILLLVLVFLRNKIVRFVGKHFGPRMQYYWKGFHEIPNTIILKVFALSIVRYISFLLPYWLVLAYLEPQISTYSLFTGLALVFLLQTTLPGFILTDLPLKGMLHGAFFIPLAAEASSVWLAVGLVFLFNQVIPSFWGLYYILFSKNYKA
jgi:hypothetical protein